MKRSQMGAVAEPLICTNLKGIEDGYPLRRYGVPPKLAGASIKSHM